MITALLCGLAFGALAIWERWARAERERRWQDLLKTLPSSDDEFDMEAWDKLSEEALDNFEQRLGPAPYDNGTDSTLGDQTTDLWPIVVAYDPDTLDPIIKGVPYETWLQQFEPTSGSLPKRGM